MNQEPLALIMKKLYLNKFLLGLLMAAISPSGWTESIQTPQANLRQAPNKNSRIMTTLPQGVEVTLLQREARYVLVRVANTGQTGWMYGDAQGWTQPIIRTTVATVIPPVESAPIPQVDAPVSVAPAPVAAIAPPAPDGYNLSGGTQLSVGEIRLEMDKRDAEVLFLKDPNDTSTFAARIRDNGATVEGKVEVKGSFTRRYPKKSLLLTLPKGQEWHGRRRIALNAMATDPTQAREQLSWDLAHTLGMVTPQVNYRKLYVNDRYIGLYLDIEWMDEAMFSRLGLADGEFYQPDDISFCGDFMPANMHRMQDCWNKLFPKNGNMDALQSLAQQLNDTPAESFNAWLEQHFDVASVIDWLVINTLTQSGDTYNKNYFLHYAPQQGKWRVIPWDYDLAWGHVADNALPYPGNIRNDNFQYAFPPVLGAENPLKAKTLKNKQLFARFQARLKEVMTPGTTPASGWFEPMRFQKKLADIRVLVEGSLAREAYPTQDKNSISTHFDTLAFFNEWRYYTLKSLLLEASPFGTPRWLPYTGYEPTTPVTPESLKQRQRQTLDLMATADLIAGKKTPFVEQLLAYPLAFATLQSGVHSARLTVEVERESAPASLPPGKAIAQCLERTWYITLKSGQSANVDLQLDYLQESSTRHELGSDIRNENALALWRYDGKAWQRTQSKLNPVANYFSVEAQQLESGVLNRYVACQDTQSN